MTSSSADDLPPWTVDEQQKLDDALRETQEIRDKKERWRNISEKVGTRDVRACVSRFRQVREALQRERDAPPLTVIVPTGPLRDIRPVCSAASTTMNIPPVPEAVRAVIQDTAPAIKNKTAPPPLKRAEKPKKDVDDFPELRVPKAPARRAVHKKQAQAYSIALDPTLAPTIQAHMGLYDAKADADFFWNEEEVAVLPSHSVKSSRGGGNSLSRSAAVPTPSTTTTATAKKKKKKRSKNNLKGLAMNFVG